MHQAFIQAVINNQRAFVDQRQQLAGGGLGLPGFRTPAGIHAVLQDAFKRGHLALEVAQAGDMAQVKIKRLQQGGVCAMGFKLGVSQALAGGGFTRAVFAQQGKQRATVGVFCPADEGVQGINGLA